MQAQIRHLDPVHAKGRLIVELPLIAKDYGTRYDLSEHVLTECIFLIVEKFNHLAIAEIREAYRRHAAGELITKGAEMWGGEFSAAQLGKVLTAYTEKRRTVAAAILREQHEAAERQKAAEREAQLRKDFEATFRARIEHAARTAKSWEEIPAFWFRACYDRGWLKISLPEAEQILQTATRLARNEELTPRSLFERASSTEDRAKVIAQKLAVFQWIKTENFKI